MRQKGYFHFVWMGLLILPLALVAGCGGGGGGESTSTNPSGGGSTSSTPSEIGVISGTAVKGPVSGATVIAYAISANGTRGSQIGPAQTDGQGNFTMRVGNHTGPIMIQVMGGTYIDEGTGQQMTMGSTDMMTAAIPNISAGSTLSGIQITPVTSMAQRMAQNMAGGMTQVNIAQANAAMGQYFGVNDILMVHPMNPTVAGSGASANQDQRNYGMIMAAMSQYAHELGMPNSSGVITAMMDDASDGVMNGMMSGGNGVGMGGGMPSGTRMQPAAGTTGMATAMTNFLQSSANKSGLTVADMAILINTLSMRDGFIHVSPPSANSMGTPLRIPPVLNPTATTATNDFYDLSVREDEVEILPGKTTRIIGFNGITPGPTIRARAGRPVTVSFSNNLPVRTLGGTPGEVVIHLHGGHVPASEDGFPTDTVLPGTGRTYTYPNNQLPSTLWYHDHLMGFTGPHVWFGMAGVYLITDDLEESLGLPGGAYEVPLVIQDRNFDGNGNLVYTGNRNGEVGNILLVNGTVKPYFLVASRKYRFRVLNGSNMRPYRLALSNGQSFQVLGMEGGLLPSPVTVNSITLAPAERIDIVIDFSAIPVGQNLMLRNLLGWGDTLDILRFEVDRKETDPSVVPSVLRPFEKLAESDAVRTRAFTLSGGMMGMGGMMGGLWTINGNPFDPNRVDADPKLGTVEIWEFQNFSMMDHPVHVHQAMFQVLEINRALPPATHAGWKDTVNVPAMGSARIIIRFSDYAGMYVFHCHVLEHEDQAMMARFDVRL